jgi:hypothetical protein
MANCLTAKTVALPIPSGMGRGNVHTNLKNSNFPFAAFM